MCVCELSCIGLLLTPWTAAHQGPLSLGFSREEYWSGLPFPPPGDRPDPRIEPTSPALQVGSLSLAPPGKHIYGGDNAGDTGSIPGLGRFSGEGNGNPLQYSSLGNPMNRGAWQATQSTGLRKVRHD